MMTNKKYQILRLAYQDTPFMNLSKFSTQHCHNSAWYIALLSSISVNCVYAQTNQPTDEVLVQSGRLTQRQFDAPTSIYT
ncbi:MAG: hypothetical protein RL659_1567, partial [Pseudomonadota bacterium]